MDKIPLFWSSDKNLLPGTWTLDKKVKKIYVRLANDTNPNKRLIEVIADNFGIDLAPSHSNKHNYVFIRNLVVRRFGFGLRLYGKHIKVENNIIEWCSYNGLWTGSRTSDILVKDNVIRWNGNSGSSFSAARGKFINNRIVFNNWKLNCPNWGSSGLKVTKALGGIIEGNKIAYNGGPGIWTDILPLNIVIKNNIVHDNTNAGLENEISDKCIWSGNVSYRNKIGFYLSSSSCVTVKGNLIADNHQGILYKFRRSRIPKGVGSKKGLKQILKKFKDCSSQALVDAWLKDFRAYHSPCSLFKDNLAEKNLFLNNIVDFVNNPPLQLPDPKEKWMISGNAFKNNILVNSKSSKMVAGFTSLAQYQKKTGDGKQCMSFSELNTTKFPEWAQQLYKKHSAKLNYPRSYRSIKNIYYKLAVQNAWSFYFDVPSPSGLLALARICESKTLKEKKFSDPYQQAYFIEYKNKPTLVLWRRHGRPADFVPILLKGVPEDAVLETSWGKKIAFQKKGELVSVNVGTWPLYIVGADKNITEVQPFSVKMPKKIEYDKPFELVIENAIGTGELYLDKNNGIEKCPEKLSVSGNKIVFPVTLKKEATIPEFRIAGHLNGLYAGRMVRFAFKKSTGIEMNGFIPISLKTVANCKPGSLLQMGKHSSLKNLPKKIKVGNIPFVIAKGTKSCIGLNSVSLKGKPRPDVVTIKLGGKKIKALAFLQVCAFALKKTGAPLLKYSINYEDNNSVSCYVKNGINILDWWHSMSKDQKSILNSNSTWLAWSGDNGFRHDVSVYAYVWKNPNPDLEVISLEISTADPDKKVRLGVLAVSNLINIPAKYNRAVFVVDGIKNKVVLKPEKGMHTASWLKKMGLDKNYLYSNSSLFKTGAWKEVEVAFMPETDGDVDLCLAGAYYCPKGEKPIPAWVEFDDVKVTGAELKNGGFEKVTENNKIANWKNNGVLVKGKTAVGNYSIRVWNKKKASQTIRVKKGQKVTIKAKVRKVE